MQSELRRELGVTASTVCRMLRSLEALGLVCRSRETNGDRRQVWVELTEKGRRAILAARTAMLRAAQRLVDHAITFGKHRDADACFRNMAQLEDYLRGMRSDFGDTATLSFPWHPDD
jgi:DNA-binding MarR family transcriptional regulator